MNTESECVIGINIGLNSKDNIIKDNKIMLSFSFFLNNRNTTKHVRTKYKADRGIVFAKNRLSASETNNKADLNKIEAGIILELYYKYP